MLDPPPIPKNPVPISADPAPGTVEEVSTSDSSDSSSASDSESEQSSDISTKARGKTKGHKLKVLPLYSSLSQRGTQCV